MSKTSLAMVLSALFVACHQGGEFPGDSSQVVISAPARTKLRGAGATFPFLAYSKWAFYYRGSHDLRFSYDKVGSRAGVAAVVAGKADFGATDIPLSDEQLQADGIIQFPMVIGGIVPVVHLPGVSAGELILSPTTLANIFIGDISRWNAPEIRAENPKIDLPDREITPIYRSDASGSTWIFSRFLSRYSPKWQARVGEGAKVSWPVGVTANDNEQVARFVHQFEFTIAYVELAHAKANGLAWVSLQMNGNVVTPNLQGLEKAAADATWSVGTSVRILPLETDNPLNWPIIGASYAVVKKQPSSADRARLLLGFFHWALTTGAPYARELNYAAVPEQHVATIERLWREQVVEDGKPVW